MGQVLTWYMTEEERLAYIERHPIRPTKKPNVVTFDNIHIDYKWRGERGSMASKKARKK